MNTTSFPFGTSSDMFLRLCVRARTIRMGLSVTFSDLFLQSAHRFLTKFRKQCLPLPGVMALATICAASCPLQGRAVHKGLSLFTEPWLPVHGGRYRPATVRPSSRSLSTRKAFESCGSSHSKTLTDCRGAQRSVHSQYFQYIILRPKYRLWCEAIPTGNQLALQQGERLFEAFVYIDFHLEINMAENELFQRDF